MAFCHFRFNLVTSASSFAGIAQLVEQLICNQQVVGSNPTAGSLNFRFSIADLGFRKRRER
jgi:hypothetical protein